MIELPESLSLAGQLNGVATGKKISRVITGQTPHKLAWFYGQTHRYAELLEGKTMGQARGIGSMVEISLGKARILFGEGVNLRFHETKETHPAKHQLLIEFSDGSALSSAVQMYGGMGAFLEGELDNPYYKVACEKPSPLSTVFDQDYFSLLINGEGTGSLSLKAFLATDQRIPGLGNGVLQDILFNAGMHPRKKVNSLSGQDRQSLFQALKTTLSAMAGQGGRDTELDLFGKPGGYRTILCKNTLNEPCPLCGALIKKEAYLGGSIYYCSHCQKQ